MVRAGEAFASRTPGTASGSMTPVAAPKQAILSTSSLSPGVVLSVSLPSSNNGSLAASPTRGALLGIPASLSGMNAFKDSGGNGGLESQGPSGGFEIPSETMNTPLGTVSAQVPATF
jgi:hypothetical protein